MRASVPPKVKKVWSASLVHGHRDVPRAVGAESAGVLVHVLVVRGLVEVPDAVEALGLAVQQLGLGHAPVVLRTREVQRRARTRLLGRHRDALRLLEDRAAEPEHRGLAVGVAVHAAAREVVGAVVLRARPLADIREVAELVHARHERKEGAAEGTSVRFLVEPAVLHALREGVGEHRRAGALRPGVRLAHELRPHAVLALLLEERLHHLAVAFQDARTRYSLSSGRYLSVIGIAAAIQPSPRPHTNGTSVAWWKRPFGSCSLSR